MTTPSLTLTGLASRRTTAREPLAPRLAYPALMLGLVLTLLGYAAAGVLLLQVLLRQF